MGTGLTLSAYSPDREVLELLLQRLEASAAPDRDLDAALVVGLLGLDPPQRSVVDGEPVFMQEPYWREGVPPLTSSLDAVFDLAQTCAAFYDLASSAKDFLADGLDMMAARGWRPDLAVLPQVARYCLRALVEDMISGAENGTGS